MSLLTKQDQYSRSFIIIWALLDVLCMIAGFYIVAALFDKTLFTFPSYKVALFTFILCWLIACHWNKAYAVRPYKLLASIITCLCKCSLLSISLTYLSLLSVSYEGQFTSASFFSVILVFLFFAFSLRVLQLIFYRNVMNLSQYQTRYIIIGDISEGQKLCKYLVNSQCPGLIFSGFFEEATPDKLNLKDLNKIYSFCKANRVNQIFCALPSDSLLYHQLLKYADHNFIRFASLKDETVDSSTDSSLVFKTDLLSKQMIIPETSLKILGAKIS